MSNASQERKVSSIRTQHLNAPVAGTQFLLPGEETLNRDMKKPLIDEDDGDKSRSNLTASTVLDDETMDNVNLVEETYQPGPTLKILSVKVISSSGIGVAVKHNGEEKILKVGETLRLDEK